ncbi:MAG: urease accessory protein UreF, partial [Ktedonobacteraceae bacterium]
MKPGPGEDALTFLSCLQLADTFFPGGLYTLSHGLETATQSGQVNAASLAALLVDYLRASFGPTDGIALACAHQACEENHLSHALRADNRLTAVKLPREARETSCRVGRQLLHIGRRIFGQQILDEYASHLETGDTPGNHAIVLGLIMATLGIPREKAALSELYAFATSFVSAGVRLTVIDYRAAQAILHQQRTVLVEVAQFCCTKGIQDIASSAPWIDIMAMRHE